MTPDDIEHTLESMYPRLPNPFTDAYVKEEIAWYGAPEEYEDGSVKLVNHTITGRCDDYLNKNFRTDNSLVVPIFAINGRTYMSLTPMEIQSAALAIYTAQGRVATCGLGMGYFALKVAEKGEVDSVTVFENNEDVIKYFKDHFADRDGYDKINIIPGDARRTCGSYQFDFLFVDTYMEMGTDDIVEDIEMYTLSNIIGEYWFWGMELVLLSALVNQQLSPYDIPNELKFYFMNWQRTKESQMAHDSHDEEYVANILTALAESGASSFDQYVE